MRFHVLALCTAAVLAPLPASAQRLPTVVTPSHYDLAFVVDLTHERFDGTETIRVQVAEPTARIVLNAAEIQFREVTIGAGAAAQTAAVALDETNQTATLTVPKPLAKGAELEGYRLVWSDEFDGAALDMQKWRYRTGARLLSFQKLDGKLTHQTDATKFPHGDQTVWLTSVAALWGNPTKPAHVDDAGLPAYADFDWVRVYRK